MTTDSVNQVQNIGQGLSMLNTTLNNIWLALLVIETRISRENHKQVNDKLYNIQLHQVHHTTQELK
jgi:hypothetical protein